jgi:hypothetical protein
MKARCRYTQIRCVGRCDLRRSRRRRSLQLAKQIRSIIGKRLDILAANAGIPKSAVIDAASLAT